MLQELGLLLSRSFEPGSRRGGVLGRAGAVTTGRDDASPGSCFKACNAAARQPASPKKALGVSFASSIFLKQLVKAGLGGIAGEST